MAVQPVRSLSAGCPLTVRALTAQTKALAILQLVMLRELRPSRRFIFGDRDMALWLSRRFRFKWFVARRRDGWRTLIVQVGWFVFTSELQRLPGDHHGR